MKNAILVWPLLLLLALISGCSVTPKLETPEARVAAAYVMHQSITQELRVYAAAGLIHPDDREKLISTLENSLAAIDAAAMAVSNGDSPDTYLAAVTTMIGMLQSYLLSLEAAK